MRLTRDISRGNSAVTANIAAHVGVVDILDGVALVLAPVLEVAKTGGGTADAPDVGVGGDGSGGSESCENLSNQHV